MRQILVEIPIPFTDWHLPIFGFGLMLCIGFFATTWWLHRLARREQLDADRVVDMALWMFVGGIVGARLLFMARNPQEFRGPLDFFKIWQGGIVFYGGVVTATLVFVYYTRRYKLPALRVLDIIAPALALGIGIGRFGCLFNGCCWGKPTDVPWAIEFPYGSIPYMDQLHRYPEQVDLGFRMVNLAGADPMVTAVSPDSWAEAAGLHRGDLIRRVGQREVRRWEGEREFRDALALQALLREFKPGSALELEVERNGKTLSIEGTFSPRPPHSLPVHPTQIYLALAGWALVPVTWVALRYRRHYGVAMVPLMFGYSISRFVIEFFRDDEPKWSDGLTISQNMSIVIFLGGFVLWGWLRRQPPIPATGVAEPERESKARGSRAEPMAQSTPSGAQGL